MLNVHTEASSTGGAGAGHPVNAATSPGRASQLGDLRATLSRTMSKYSTTGLGGDDEEDAKMHNKLSPKEMELQDLKANELFKKAEEILIQVKNSEDEKTMSDLKDKVGPTLEQARLAKDPVDGHLLVLAMFKSGDKAAQTVQSLLKLGASFDYSVPRLSFKGRYSAKSLGAKTVDPGSNFFHFSLKHLYAVNPEEAIKIVCLFIQRMDSVKALKELAKYTEHTEINPTDLNVIGRTLITSSKYPLVESLELAALCSQLAKTYIVNEEDYHDLEERFTQTAVNMLLSFESDHQAYVALFESNAVDHSPIYVALRNFNYKFVSNARVCRVIETLWSVPNFMKQPSFYNHGYGFHEIAQFIFSKPHFFFRLPFGKFAMQITSFMAFLGLFSITAIIGIDANDTKIHAIEIVVWSMMIGFVRNELKELSNIGVQKYYLNFWNKIDSLLYFNFIILMISRISCSALANQGSDSPALLVLAYEGLTACNLILMWVRITFLFTIHRSLGPLLVTVLGMLLDVFKFVALLTLFVAGFGLSFYFLARNSDLDSFSDPYLTLMTMLRAMLGDFDYSMFSDLDTALRVVLQVLSTLYQFIVIVVLLNLLIAMMSKTYEAVQDRSLEEFLFAKAKITWELDITDNEIPPPLNILVEVFYQAYKVLKCVGSAACMVNGGVSDVAGDEAFADDGDKQHSGGASPMSVAGLTFPWRCSTCHHLNERSESTAIALGTHTRLDQVELEDEVGDALTQKALLETLSKNDLVSGETVICSKCWTVARTLGDEGYFKERASFAVFKIFLWIPIGVLVCAPFWFNWIVTKTMAFLDCTAKQRQETVAFKTKYTPNKSEEEIERNQPREEVLGKFFVEPEVTIQDVWDELEHLQHQIGAVKHERHH